MDDDEPCSYPLARCAAAAVGSQPGRAVSFALAAAVLGSFLGAIAADRFFGADGAAGSCGDEVAYLREELERRETELLALRQLLEARPPQPPKWKRLTCKQAQRSQALTCPRQAHEAEPSLWHSLVALPLSGLAAVLGRYSR